MNKRFDYFIPAEEVYRENGITEEDLKDWEDVELDFSDADDEELIALAEERWKIAEGLIKADGLETSAEFKALRDKEIRGEITTEDMIQLLTGHYKEKVKGNDTIEAMLEAERIVDDESVKRYSDVEEALRALKE